MVFGQMPSHSEAVQGSSCQSAHYAIHRAGSRIVDGCCYGVRGVHRENIRDLSTLALPFASECISYVPSTCLGEYDRRKITKAYAQYWPLGLRARQARCFYAGQSCAREQVAQAWWHEVVICLSILLRERLLEIYGREWYDDLRQKYNATSLPSVYDKVRIDVEVETKAVKSSWWLWFLSFWPISGFWSLWKANASRQYLLAASWRSIEEEHRKDSGDFFVLGIEDRG